MKKNAATEITQSQRKQKKNLMNNRQVVKIVQKSLQNLTQNRTVIILNINEPYVTIKRQR